MTPVGERAFAEEVLEVERELDALARWLAGARRAVVFTGAGISTESGIPDFRGPGGVWTRYDPKEFTFDRFVSDPEHRKRSWRTRAERFGGGGERRPNEGHLAIARLEELGCVRGVVTQNVDGLHQDAGSQHVLEVHGTTKRVACLSCSASWPSAEIIERVRAGEEDPACTECGGILKSATISFGQQLPADVLEEAHRWTLESDVFLTVGSSLVVYPVAALPGTARNAGARVGIINREPTEQDHIADAVVHGEAGATLSNLAGRVEALLRS